MRGPWHVTTETTRNERELALGFTRQLHYRSRIFLTHEPISFPCTLFDASLTPVISEWDKNKER